MQIVEKNTKQVGVHIDEPIVLAELMSHPVVEEHLLNEKPIWIVPTANRPLRETIVKFGNELRDAFTELGYRLHKLNEEQEAKTT